MHPCPTTEQGRGVATRFTSVQQHPGHPREFGEFNRDFLAAVEAGKAAGQSAAETAASLDLPEVYANYAMSRGTLTSAQDNAEKIYAELD